jgi:hypothetical protein
VLAVGSGGKRTIFEATARQRGERGHVERMAGGATARRAIAVVLKVPDPSTVSVDNVRCELERYTFRVAVESAPSS